MQQKRGKRQNTNLLQLVGPGRADNVRRRAQRPLIVLVRLAERNNLKERRFGLYLVRGFRRILTMRRPSREIRNTWRRDFLVAKRATIFSGGRGQFEHGRRGGNRFAHRQKGRNSLVDAQSVVRESGRFLTRPVFVASVRGRFLLRGVQSRAIRIGLDVLSRRTGM